MRLRGIFKLFLATALTILAGCGGGSGSGTTPTPTPTPSPTQAIVKLQTSGTLPPGTTIGGITATVTYPNTKGVSITDNNVVVSGAGTGSILVANVNTAGQAVVALISSTGIQSGEFATMTCSIASGNSPTASDFAITSGSSIIDANGTAIPGMTVAIQGVTFQ